MFVASVRSTKLIGCWLHCIVMCLCGLATERSRCRGNFECEIVFQCIPIDKYNDGVADCIDGSDEPALGN